MVSPNSIVKQVNKMLASGYELWDGYQLPGLSPQEKETVVIHAAESYGEQPYTCEYAAACQCFYLFRKLHAMMEASPEQTTLLGDYFFSQFSRYLIPIDSTRLIDVFSDYLKEDVVRAMHEPGSFDMDRYLKFIEQAVKEI